MYGIVNQSFRHMIVDDYGIEKWEEIKKSSGIEIDYFLSDYSYEDNVTYELIGAAVEVLKKDASSILEDFGKYWILNTGNKKYGELMKAGGSTFIEFMKNLPNFHARIMLIYKDIRPPEFRVEISEKNKITLHYYSERNGLTHFVIGLMHGIAGMFNEIILVNLIKSESNKYYHDTFEIELIN